VKLRNLSIISGPLPTESSLQANHAKLQEVPTFHTSATQCNNASDSHSPEPFPSSFSITNVVDNAELSIQFKRVLESQSASYDHEKQTANQFIHDYQQQLEFRDGQYFAPLPWKTDHPPLPSNLELCKRCLDQVTTQLNKLGLTQQYCKVMDEHLAKGYIEELSDSKQPWPEQGYHYLPHFYVLKNSDTTPLHIVFATNSRKVSLNDCLYTGPSLLNNLVELILRFRFPHYAFVANIQQAFLHIKLCEEDNLFVRFPWYKDNDPTKEI